MKCSSSEVVDVRDICAVDPDPTQVDFFLSAYMTCFDLPLPTIENHIVRCQKLAT